MKTGQVLLKFILATLALLAFTNSAQATITCTPSSIGFTTAYPMTGGALNITAASLTVTCTHNNRGTSSATIQVAVSSANGWIAVSGANSINYFLATDSGCTIRWQGTTYIPTPAYVATIPLRSTRTYTYSFYGCVPAGQTLPAGGTYNDTVTMSFTTPSGGGVRYRTGTFAPRIIAPATCSFSTPPGNMVFNYTAFGAAAAASTTFAANCSQYLPYNLSLDAGGAGYTGSFTSPTGTYTNTATNLTYTLTLPAPVTGTGVAQSYTITGAMAAGQGGTCAAGTCTVTDTHTLTVTY
jgi:spore coat protein U-like protein